MENIFRDIAERTGGDVYLGVVGPVRVGKSTFIKRFMDLLVIPNIVNSYDRERAIDELPQSGAGKTIMTTEPKFVPNEAVEIQIKEGLKVAVRLADCVGYTIPGAKGYEDENGPRMVNTPWSEEAMPFQEAAEMGTRKVITDHSTIGIVLTTDGSITELPRENYVEAEERIVEELKALGKPFVVILNSVQPHDVNTIELAQELENNYEVPVIPVDVAQMSQGTIMQILEEALFEFPVNEVNISLPKWIEELASEHWLRSKFESSVQEIISQVRRLRDIDQALETLSHLDFIGEVVLESMDMGTGTASIEMTARDGLFYEVLNEATGLEITGEHDIYRLMKELTFAKVEYDKVAAALERVRECGYGVVNPIMSEMILEEPELIKQGGLFGVKLKASAPSLHIIRTDITTEITPLMGTERQCADLAQYIMDKFQENPSQIWNYDIFGKSLQELVTDNIQNKLQTIPQNVQDKLKETLRRIVNDGSGGIICIII
ncbi:MAG TPA: stage IV sporulation protein A [Peptococcaceae bacterium]|nr:stage IV sporulation protein A [Clostridia bacterium]HOB81262.1 stage IV sporulation protein A [Peptococcaceae bacterium]HQD53348.1 stage IV sporulation protein A [Peptococcaceae bacterium]